MDTETAKSYKQLIQGWKADIYTPIDRGSKYWIPTNYLEYLLNIGMTGLSLSGLPLRTRSKVVKQAVCSALGYPIPSSFEKTQPRFFGQQLDVYTQKSLNLQIWNEELKPDRRYAIIQVSTNDVILKVRVVNGQELAQLDKTGTLTTKYQARLDTGLVACELVSLHDSHGLLPYVASTSNFESAISPTDEPEVGSLLPIQEIFKRLSPLIGTEFIDPGKVHERNRGAGLHRLVCQQLGYSRYEDNGQFPDVRHQLLEVKLQTSLTIDLGLVLPNSMDVLSVQCLGAYQPLHCDTRYAVFQAQTDGETVALTNLSVVTGQDFFTRFRQFAGKIQNRKLQIPLPHGFFS